MPLKDIIQIALSIEGHYIPNGDYSEITEKLYQTTGYIDSYSLSTVPIDIHLLDINNEKEKQVKQSDEKTFLMNENVELKQYIKGLNISQEGFKAKEAQIQKESLLLKEQVDQLLTDQLNKIDVINNLQEEIESLRKQNEKLASSLDGDFVSTGKYPSGISEGPDDILQNPLPPPPPCTLR